MSKQTTKIKKNVYKGTVKGVDTAVKLVKGGASIAKNFGSLLRLTFSPYTKVRAIGGIYTGVKSLLRQDAKRKVLNKKAQDLLQSRSHSKGYTEFTGRKTNALDNKVSTLKSQNRKSVVKTAKTSKDIDKNVRNLTTSLAGYGSLIGGGVNIYNQSKQKVTGRNKTQREKQLDRYRKSL